MPARGRFELNGGIFRSLVKPVETRNLELKDLFFVCVGVYESLQTDVPTSLSTFRCLPVIFGDLLPETDAR